MAIVVAQRRIRVLQLLPSLRMGGPAYVVSGLLKYLGRSHFESTLCTMYDLPPSAEIPFPVKELGIPWVHLRMKRFLEPRTWRNLSRLLRGERFDIVHTHLTRADWYGRTIAHRCRFPRVVSTIHGQDRFFNLLDFGPLGGRLVAAVNRFTVRWVDGLVAVSEGVREYLIDVERISPQKISVVRNGIELDEFDPSVADVAATRQRLGIPQDALVVGTVCQLHPRKGLVYLLRAAREVAQQVSRACFVLVGLGPQEAELRALASTLGLETKVLFRGGPHPEVASIMRAMDVFVLPSLIEGLGLAVLEAQALERPCVVTSIPGLSEAVVPDQTAIVIAPEDEGALAEALLFLLAHEQERRIMGKAGRRFIEEHYSARQMARKYEEVYQGVLSAP